jgi:hypothetical protein
MDSHITVVLRRPERIRRGCEAARELSGLGMQPNVVFLCPGCSSRLACRNGGGAAGEPWVPCFTDRCDDCIPLGFRCADAGRIEQLLRASDFVVPL